MLLTERARVNCPFWLTLLIPLTCAFLSHYLWFVLTYSMWIAKLNLFLFEWMWIMAVFFFSQETVNKLLQQFFRDKQKTKCEFLKYWLCKISCMKSMHVKGLVQGYQSFRPIAGLPHVSLPGLTVCSPRLKVQRQNLFVVKDAIIANRATCKQTTLWA